MAVRDDFAPGEVLTASDLNDTLAQKADVTNIVGRNLLYNGAMQVAQRGTSRTGITSAVYCTADRWLIDTTLLGTWTNTIENDAPTGSGFRKSFKMLCTTASPSPNSAGYVYVQQGLEGQDVQTIFKGTASAKPLTVSFWVKANVTGTYIVALFDNDNNRAVSATYTISASSTWEKKIVTFPADTTGVLDNDNNRSLSLYFGLAVGSGSSSGTLQTTWGTFTVTKFASGQTNLAAATNNYWQVTGVQLEVGANATEYEHVRFGDELSRCERYFEKAFQYSDAPAHGIGDLYILPYGGNLGCGGNAYITVPFRTQKRATGGTLRFFDPVASHTFSENWVRVITNCTSGTGHQTSGIGGANSSAIIIYFQVGSQPVISLWTCESEL